MDREKRLRRRLITVLVLIVLAGFFKFALMGYAYTALCLLCGAASVAVYWLALFLGPRAPGWAVFLRRGMTVFLIVFLAAYAATEVWIICGSRGDKEPKADTLIVLGAGVNGTVPSRSLRDRLEAAGKYLERYPDARCIVSGGQGGGEDISEARCMAQWLTERGIDPERIFEEADSTDTVENFRNSFAIHEENGGGTVAVLSSEYHLARARLIAKGMGYTVKTVPARTSIFPLKINYFLREVAGVWKCSLLGLSLKP